MVVVVVVWGQRGWSGGWWCGGRVGGVGAGGWWCGGRGGGVGARGPPH